MLAGEFNFWMMLDTQTRNYGAVWSGPPGDMRVMPKKGLWRDIVGGPKYDS